MEIENYDEAEIYLMRALNGRQSNLGLDNPDTLKSIFNMGVLCFNIGKNKEAEKYFMKALDGQTKVLGEDHQDTLSTNYFLSSMLILQHSAVRLWCALLATTTAILAWL